MGRNKAFKSKWRKHFAAAEKLQHSRMDRIVKVMFEVVRREEKPTMDVVAEFEPVFVECNKNIHDSLQWCMNKGHIKKHNNRGRKAVE